MPLKKQAHEPKGRTGSARNSSNQRPTRGRAASRSRLGCTTCKRRHVRCDEKYPSCGHCFRLQLHCYYLPRSRETIATPATSTPRRLLPAPSISGASIATSPDTEVTASYPTHKEHVANNLRDPTDCTAQFDSFSWCDDGIMVTGMDNIIPEFGSSWAGEMQDFGSLLSDFDAASRDLAVATSPEVQAVSEYTESGPGIGSILNNEAALWQPSLCKQNDLGRSVQRAKNDDGPSLLTPPECPQNENSLRVFGKIMQPPAAMLMGGIKRWRHLQRYLLNLGTRNEAVMSALRCLDNLLERDGANDLTGPTQELQDSIRTSCERATCKIQEELPSTPCHENAKMDEWLAVIFLLAWIQVLRDRAEHDSETFFPSELADTIITCSYDWNWYSRQLLSWFNSLDSKASHLSGPTLLSTKALKIVSRYPIQIISCDYEESKGRQDSLGDDHEFQAMSSSPTSEVSEHGDSAVLVPARSSCDVKEIVLRAILQPAAEWYLETQAYCRQISALDKHHQKRFTPDTEIKVALAGKRIHNKLWDLWAQRPAAISLSSAELSKSVAHDVATRLQEISSVYLASFWILFVYLHRVCWWHLPHTGTVSGALEETWKHMQYSYGESDISSHKKTVHPALMWPVFLFGAECNDEVRRDWAIEQLKALGKERPVLKSESQNQDTLPAFRMSQGATRNAKRAAFLLQTLIDKQEEAKCRIDDRDLAMDMFGCYFSIV